MTDRRLTALSAAVIAALSVLLYGCSGNDTVVEETQKSEEITISEKERLMKEASKTPYGKYPELVTYKLGKLAGADNSNMPEGDTYEDNVYTRYLKNMLNIQNEDVFEKQDNEYSANISMAVTSGELPDIFLVESAEELRALNDQGLIEDLTQAFDNCLTDTIKDIYRSYGSSIIDGVTFDGRIMAIPETNIEDGPNLLWLRKDWMDKLGLEAPKTLKDAENIISEFIEKDPGNNGEGNTIGLVCDPGLCGECGYSSEYLLDIVFASYGAYPKQWVYDSFGNIAYGSVMPEAKRALKHINEMYQKGILSKNFLFCTSSNNIDLIAEGKCGSFFGPWWAPNNPLMQAVKEDPQADWEPYLIQTDDDGSTSYYSQNPTYKYVVVRKGYEHPEIVCKIISTTFDYLRYQEENMQEFYNYFENNVDPTARPLSINIDYSDALTKCYKNLTEALNSDKIPESMGMIEKSYYEPCRKYLEDPDNASPEEWAAYTSRIKACSLLSEGKLNRVESLFYNKTETMNNEWWKLKQLESETYLKIVTGKADIDEFDNFVYEWNTNGGRAITMEVREALGREKQ